MLEMKYEVYMSTPLGRKPWMLLIQQEGSCLTGWLEILRHKERIDGSVDENGNCQIKGIFITLLNTVPFVATGRMTDSCIHLFMEDQENRRFQMSGNLYIELGEGNWK